MRALVAFLLVLGCAGPDSRVPSPGSQENRPQTPDPGPGTRDPGPRRELNVRLESPREGDVIRENPVMIHGQARTFENNVAIRLLDSSGQLLVETFATAVGEMGTFSAFSREVFLTRHPGPQLTVQAFEYSAKDGSVQHLNSVTVPVELRTQAVRLYFPSATRSPTDCSVVFPVTREIPTSKSLARLLTEALIAGPTTEEQKSGADQPFPPGSSVRSVVLRNGVLTVDLNERLQNVGGSCRALAIRSALERTLTELPTVGSVRITALGEEKTALQP